MRAHLGLLYYLCTIVKKIVHHVVFKKMQGGEHPQQTVMHRDLRTSRTGTVNGLGRPDMLSEVQRWNVELDCWLRKGDPLTAAFVRA